MSEINLDVLIITADKKKSLFYRKQLKYKYTLDAVYHADNIEQGLLLTQQEKPNLILINLDPDNINGIDFIKAVRDKLRLSIPIIIITDVGNARIATQALIAGANEYFTFEEINKPLFYERLNAVFLKQETANTFIKDCIEYKSMALLDSLTGLYNRSGFKEYASKALSYAERHDWPLSCLYIDLDNFKNINDEYTHEIGDCLLKEVAARLKEVLRQEDIIARYGGDEFVVITVGQDDPNKIALIAKKIINAIKKPFHLDKKPISINASIGIATKENNNMKLEELVHHADIALHQQKKNHKGHYGFYHKVC